LRLCGLARDNSSTKKQLLTYLTLTGMKLGLLINFGAPLIKDGIVRLVNGLSE
jgi:GxxExxY protein